MEASDRQRNTESADGTATLEAPLPATGGRADGDGEHSLPIANAVHVVHQRRRVNPESLALRLGPDLVRDLDALITPGNTEMPSFAVRKELQERYSIDRRHIYDYFHSRGLRVVKEDKHGNPVLPKDLPTGGTILPNLRPLRQAPMKISRSHTSYPVAKLFKPRGIMKAKPGRPKKTPSAKIVPPAWACETNESTDTNASVSEHSSPGMAPNVSYVSVNPLLSHNHLAEEHESRVFNSVVKPLDESFSVSRAIGDTYRRRPVFERMQELTECPVKLSLGDDQPLSWNETSPCSASAKGLLLPHAKPLARDERYAIYDSLSDSLGPAHGIQECQGTYRKHMEARTKLYFEGLLSVPCNHAHQPARINTLLDQKVPIGTNEFRHWLSETRFLKRDGVNNSPRIHASHRNANAAKLRNTGSATDKQSRQRYIPHWLQTLDDLFPTLGDNWNNDDPLADSPIVQTPEATRTAVYARDVAYEHTVDRQLFPATTSAGVPNFANKYTAETQLTGPLRFHGLAGFPGSQEVKMQMFPEMDGSQPLELDTRTTLQSALGDTLRKNRNMSHNARTCIPSRSPRRPQVRDLDRIRTRPTTTRDGRRRTTSAAGDI